MLKHAQLSYWEHKTFLNGIDIVIIGAGIVGYSTGIHLKRKYPNAKIIILERGYLPSGASTKNAGFACFGSPTEIWDDLSRIKEDVVWETVAKRFSGLHYLSELLGNRTIGFENNGSWDLISNEDQPAYIESKKLLPYLNEKIGQITGEKEVYSEDRSVSKKFGFKGISSSFFNRLEAQIDTSQLNRHLYQLVIESDIEVLFGHEAKELRATNDGAEVETQYGTIHAGKVVICTNGFANDLIGSLDVQPARAQVLITEPIVDLQLKGTFHFDMGYYYFRNIDNRILLGGGRNLDFEGEHTKELTTTIRIQNELDRLLQEMILPDQRIQITHRWSGIMGVGSEKKPVVRKLNDHTYCAVRMGGMGVAIGSLIGKEMAEMI